MIAGFSENASCLL